MGTIQAAVDDAVGSTTIFITGTCVEDVSITKDDITLSGNEAGDLCDKANPGGTGIDPGIINGTVTVDGVRAKIEFLTITGLGEGVRIENRADARLTCNDISNNAESGVVVWRSSNAVLRDNTLSGNGTRENNPFIFFDNGLYVLDASSVRSDGNTYKDNQYAAVESDRQSYFRNASFLPRENGHPPIPAEKDVIIQKGGNPAVPATCKADIGPVAIEIFNGGLAEFRNADVCGKIESSINSSIRFDDAGGAIIGNVSATLGSFVRIKDRSNFLDGRLTTFDGTLTCSGGSQTFGSDVQCGQTCTSGISPSAPGGDTCTP